MGMKPKNVGFLWVRIGYEIQKKLGLMGLGWVLGTISNTYPKTQLFLGSYVCQLLIMPGAHLKIVPVMFQVFRV